jgi:pimeloyl-ACP methyl ester carboxylesterase
MFDDSSGAANDGRDELRCRVDRALPRRRAGIVVWVVGGLLLGACSNGGGTTQSPSVTQPAADTSTAGSSTTALPVQAELEWRPCDDPVALDPRLECATLPVPLDHADPLGASIEIALIRDPAPISWERSGAVITNPGGPGASGFDYVAATAATLRLELGLQRFDIIGFDPRGVDRSGGLRCFSDDELDAVLYLDRSPDTPEEQAQLDEAPVFADACARTYGDTLRHYSTENTARDVDLIRQALGDEQITFLGVSYGTYLAAVTATLFPDRVRAMVLDSAVSPDELTTSPDEVTMNGIYAIEDVSAVLGVEAWATWCDRDPAACPIAGRDPAEVWTSLYERLDADGLRTSEGRAASHLTLTTATWTALSFGDGWSLLGAALVDAEAGRPELLMELADQGFGPRADGTYPTLAQSLVVVRCADGRPLANFDPFVDLTRGQGCEGVTTEIDPVTIGPITGIPTVIIGGEQDFITPMEESLDMLETLGPDAVLVRYEGAGHGLVSLSSCLSDIAAALIEELALPARGVRCKPDPDIERPAWWSELPFDGWLDDVGPDPELLGALGWSTTDYYVEAGTSSLGLDELLAAADEAIGGQWGVVELSRFEYFPGVDQLNFSIDGDDLAVIVVGRDDLGDPNVAALAPFVDDDQTLVLLVHIPFPE